MDSFNPHVNICLYVCALHVNSAWTNILLVRVGVYCREERGGYLCIDILLISRQEPVTLDKKRQYKKKKRKKRIQNINWIDEWIYELNRQINELNDKNND